MLYFQQTYAIYQLALWVLAKTQMLHGVQVEQSIHINQGLIKAIFNNS